MRLYYNIDRQIVNDTGQPVDFPWHVMSAKMIPPHIGCGFRLELSVDEPIKRYENSFDYQLDVTSIKHTGPVINPLTAKLEMLIDGVFMRDMGVRVILYEAGHHEYIEVTSIHSPLTTKYPSNRSPATVIIELPLYREK